MYSQQKTKFYRQLPEFTSLDILPPDLYFHFLKFTLTEEQLGQYGFPRESPDHGSRILGKNKKPPGDKSLRHCVRCGGEFRISDNGEYSADKECYYHSKKITALNGVPGAGRYLCCDGKFLAHGCKHNIHHVSAELFLDNIPFVKVREKKQVRGGESCTVFGLDCEMCYTMAGLEVTKVGVVSMEGLTMYETYVKPEKPILDYNTEYSGVTAKDLEGITTSIKDVQDVLLRLLNKNSILVGHALENDLGALRIVHKKIVDTSILFPHRRGGKYRNSLKMLAETYLGKIIQADPKGHDCIEDARTCMSLVLDKIGADFKLSAVHDENHNSFLQNDAYAADICATPLTWGPFIPASKAQRAAFKQPRHPPPSFKNDLVSDGFPWGSSEYSSIRPTKAVNTLHYTWDSACDSARYRTPGPSLVPLGPGYGLYSTTSVPGEMNFTPLFMDSKFSNSSRCASRCPTFLY